VEFALVLPLLVAFLLMVVVAGSVYVDQQHLQSVARDAARAASVDPSSACDVAAVNLATNDVGTHSCVLVDDCSDGTSSVRITADQDFSLPIIGQRTVTLSATSTFACLP
jgi:Flp pilus assembly protein TadG